MLTRRLRVSSRYLATQWAAGQPVNRRTGGAASAAEMFKTEKLRALVNERLKAAAEEIFSLFEQTVRDYEEEVIRSKQELDQQQRRSVCEGNVKSRTHWLTLTQ